MNSAATRVQPTATREVGPGAPVTFNQDRHLRVEGFASRVSAGYVRGTHGRICLRLEGDVDPGRIERALAAVVGRHAALQVSFSRSGERRRMSEPAREDVLWTPYAMSIDPAAAVSLHVETLDGLEREARELRYQELASEAVGGRFDLSRAPLMRAVLFSFGRRSYVLLVVVHHLVSDEVSLQILRRELKTLCGSADGEAAGLPDVERQYPDFARWERRFAESGRFDRSVAYWRDRWAEFRTARVGYRNLPFRRPGGDREAGGGLVGIRFDGATSGRLRSFARRARITLCMLFIAGLGAVLHRYTGQPRLALWLGFANRMEKGTRNMVGWLANTHIVGFDCSDDPSGWELLECVRAAVLEGHVHQHVPLPLLWRLTGLPPRYTDGGVAFEAIQAFGGGGSEGLGGARARRTGVPHVGREEELRIRLEEAGGVIHASATYPASRLSRRDVGALLDDVRRALVQMVGDPANRLSSLDLPRSKGEAGFP